MGRVASSQGNVYIKDFLSHTTKEHERSGSDSEWLQWPAKKNPRKLESLTIRRGQQLATSFAELSITLSMRSLASLAFENLQKITYI